MAPAPSSAAQGAGAPSAARIKRDKADLIAEHLGFSAERFATQGMDLANRTMYTATAKVEQSLQKLVDDGVEGFDEDEVQRVCLLAALSLQRLRGLTGLRTGDLPPRDAPRGRDRHAVRPVRDLCPPQHLHLCR